MLLSRSQYLLSCACLQDYYYCALQVMISCLEGVGNGQLAMSLYQLIAFVSVFLSNSTKHLRAATAYLLFPVDN